MNRNKGFQVFGQYSKNWFRYRIDGKVKRKNLVLNKLIRVKFPL